MSSKMNPNARYGMLAAILLIASAFSSLPALAGICTNPNSDASLCREVGQNACCPTPETSFPDYYSTAGGKGTSDTGPSDAADCQQNYFKPSGTADPACSVKCCCPEGSLGYEAQCASTAAVIRYNVTVDPLKSCKQTCQATPPPPGIGTPGPVPPPIRCNNPQLLLDDVPGRKEVALSWSTNCLPSKFEILRCEGAGCTNFEKIFEEPKTASSRTDSDGSLEWSTSYRYRLNAVYADGTVFSTTMPITLGDEECEGKALTDRFCLQEGGRANRGWSCNDENQLVLEADCNPDKVCTETGGNAVCILQTNCQDAGRPLGLFGTNSGCEDGNYCLYDRSYSVVNSCYDCSQGMECYDYKSEQACERNNCNAGNCAWRSTQPELGVGACIDTDKNNCKWCLKEGTEGMQNINSYNKVFDRCTKEKAEALSTTQFTCSATDKPEDIVDCATATCTSYKSSQNCNKHGDVEIQSDNGLVHRGSDACSLDACRWFGSASKGSCNKDADMDFRKDCSSEDCEKDLFPPSTSLAIGTDKITLRVEDREARGEPKKTVSDAETFLCGYLQGEPSCGSSGHPYPYSTGEEEVSFAELIAAGVLKTGTNFVRFYSQDSAKNLEVVQTTTVTVKGGVSIVAITEPQGNSYVKSAALKVIGVAKMPAPVKVAQLKVTAGTATIHDVKALLSAEGVFSKDVTLSQNQNVLLLSVKDQNDVQVDSLPVVVSVDNTAPNISILQPSPFHIFQIAADVNVSSNDTLSGIKNATAEVWQGSSLLLLFPLALTQGTTFAGYWSGTLPLSSIPQGTYTLKVTASDFAGNSQTASVSLMVDHDPPQLLSVSPLNQSTNPLVREINATLFDANPISVPFFEILDVTAFPQLPAQPVAGTGSFDSAKSMFLFTAASNLADGMYEVRLNATDSLGQPAIYTWEFKVSSGMPVIYFDPFVNETTATLVTVSGSVSGQHPIVNNSVTLRVDPAGTTTSIPLLSGLFSQLITLTEGINTVTATAKNTANLTGTAQIRIERDTTPPEGTIEIMNQEIFLYAGEFAAIQVLGRSVVVEVFGVNGQVTPAEATVGINGNILQVTAGSAYVVDGIPFRVTEIVAKGAFGYVAIAFP